jgi:hypothetical protein
MLWTVFMFLSAVWMLGLVFRFGVSSIPTVLVLAVFMLALKQAIRRRSFN